MACTLKRPMPALKRDGNCYQDAGRLIRTKTATDIVVVLDNRILTKQYGEAFIDALPKCPVEIV